LQALRYLTTEALSTFPWKMIEISGFQVCFTAYRADFLSNYFLQYFADLLLQLFVTAICILVDRFRSLECASVWKYKHIMTLFCLPVFCNSRYSQIWFRGQHTDTQLSFCILIYTKPKFTIHYQLRTGEGLAPALIRTLEQTSLPKWQPPAIRIMRKLSLRVIEFGEVFANTPSLG
jgi:hypothetical protein